MDTKKEILYLNASEVEALVSYQRVLELTEESFREYALGYAVNPEKLHLPLYPDYEGYTNVMPAYLKRLKITGAKVVSVYRDNPKKGLPATTGTIVLNDVETGVPVAFMDGTYITAARTGAVQGVMAKYLAKPEADTLTVIGTGAQGLSSFRMIHMALHESLQEVRLVDIRPEAQERFIRQAKEVFPDLRYEKYNDIQSACRGADLVLAAATTETPLLLGIDFDKGTTVLVVEDDINNRYVAQFDAFIGDFKECLVMRINQDITHHAQLTGEPCELLSPDAVTGEIGDIIVGKCSGRKNEEEIILASSVGMGIQDIIVANEAFQLARTQEKGTQLSLF